jgi:nucleotide-binding universal stress UspA family protein
VRLNTGPLILPTTGLDRALVTLPGVASLAHALKRPLLVVHVLGKRYEEYSKRRVAETIAPLNGLGPSEVRVVRPKERLAKLREIAASEGGVIVTMPQRRSFLGRLASMITDYEQLILEGPLPVLALPTRGATNAEIRRVLFPIDLSPRSEAAFDDTIAFCAEHGAELHLLHAFGADRLLAAEINQAERDAARNPAELYQVDKRHMQVLADRVRERGVPVTLQQAEGRAHTTILGYAGSNAIDLIVMATHGPRSNEDIWYGTTTARVIQRAQVPVIAVRA